MAKRGSGISYGNRVRGKKQESGVNERCSSGHDASCISRQSGYEERKRRKGSHGSEEAQTLTGVGELPRKWTEEKVEAAPGQIEDEVSRGGVCHGFQCKICTATRGRIL
jgi:hypothetical protein